MDFILSNFCHLKIIKLPRPVYMNYTWIKSQTKKALLPLQKRDHEKTIIIYHRSQEKAITLPWPPLLPSQLHIDLQA